MAQTTIQGSFLDSTLDITSLVLSGASPLVFEGATADAHETTLAFVDPTADRTITFPNTTGTIALTSDLTSYITISSTDTFTNKTFDADGTGNSLTNVENANVKAAAAIALNKLAATTVSRALVSDGSGFVSASAVTATEIGHLDGVTGAIQTQFTAKAPIASPTFTTGATSPAFITGNSGTLKLVDGDGNHFTTLAAHATTIADVAYTWPNNAPGTSGFALTSTTGGVMSWAAAGGAALTGSTNNTIVTVTGADAMQGEANLTFTGTSLINTSANDAGDNVISVINTSNTTNDGAYVDIQSGGNAAGDAYVHFDANSEWSVGVDRDQGRFAISYNASGAKPGNTDILTIEQTGKISFAASSQEIAMSGNSITELAGVNFLASQSASANANTMDDYEEGTFTPAINFGGASSGVSYSSRLGAYTKIGDRCYFTIRIVLSSKGSSTGVVNVTGLPFTVYNNAANYSACPVQFAAVSFADMVMVQLNINDTIVVIWEMTNAGVLTQLDNANYADNSTMHISGQYKTA